MELMAKMEPKATGSTRPPGVNGTQGPQVERGFNGTQGPPGPSGVVNASNAYVVWQDNTLGNNEIFFRTSQGLGTINVSNNTGISSNPQIATSGNNNVYVTWSDNTPATLISSLRQVTITYQFCILINLSNNTRDSDMIANSSNRQQCLCYMARYHSCNFDIFVITNAQPFGTPVNIRQ